MDSMTIEILPDGTIKVDSGRISQQNHMTAEAFLRFMATATGGRQDRKHKHGVLGAGMHAVKHAFGLGHSH